MAKELTELFKNRNVTQDFLFSRSDGTAHGERAAPVLPAALGTGDTLRQTPSDDLLDRKQLMDVIATRMATAPFVSALAIRVAWTGQAPSNETTPLDIPEATIRPMTTFCRLHGGHWARLDNERFVCVFPVMGAAAGKALARQMLQSYPAEWMPVITIGAAAYPTLNEPRSQVVANAEKALTHAGFLGPGSIAVFDAVSLNISGDQRYQAGNIAGAIAEFQKGLRVDPTDANLHNSLGVCYGVLKAYDQALNAFENAIWLAPQEGMAMYNKGYILLLQKQYDQALECLLEADAREPNLFEVVFHIGLAYMQLGAIPKARPYFEAAGLIKQRSGAAFVNLGACLDRLGMTKEAVQAYKRAVKINPTDAESLSTLGRLYTQRGESLDVASVLCRQSVQLAPENGLFRHRLGEVYLHRGEPDRALAEFEQAAALGHDSQGQIDAARERMPAAKAS